MDTTELSPIARRRLWQCYTLLLELAEQADLETIDPVDSAEEQLLEMTENNVEITSSEHVADQSDVDVEH